MTYQCENKHPENGVQDAKPLSFPEGFVFSFLIFGNPSFLFLSNIFSPAKMYLFLVTFFRARIFLFSIQSN